MALAEFRAGRKVQRHGWSFEHFGEQNIQASRSSSGSACQYTTAPLAYDHVDSSCFLSLPHRRLLYIIEYCSGWTLKSCPSVPANQCLKRDSCSRTQHVWIEFAHPTERYDLSIHLGSRSQRESIRKGTRRLHDLPTQEDQGMGHVLQHPKHGVKLTIRVV